jgi:hypothetical protein
MLMFLNSQNSKGTKVCSMRVIKKNPFFIYELSSCTEGIFLQADSFVLGNAAQVAGRVCQGWPQRSHPHTPGRGLQDPRHAQVGIFPMQSR